MQIEPLVPPAAPKIPLVPRIPSRAIETFFYNDKIIRDFGIATVVWSIIGMLVGVLVAFQLARPEADMNTAYTTFGLISPLHTNAVIFAFIGNGIFMSVYYSVFSGAANA